MEKPPRIPRKTATMWLVQQPYPNNNGGRTVIRLTEHLRIVIAQIDRLLEEEQKAIGNQEAGNSEEDDDEEASEVEHVQENEFVPEQEAYVEEPVENEPPEQEVFIPTEAETQVKESEVKPYIPGGEYRPSVSTGNVYSSNIVFLTNLLSFNDIEVDTSFKHLLTEAIRADIAFENLQMHNQSLEPNTDTHILYPTPMVFEEQMFNENFEGDTAFSATNKDGNLRELVALSPQKQGSIHIETTVNPLASSQKDDLVEKAHK